LGWSMRDTGCGMRTLHNFTPTDHRGGVRVRVAAGFSGTTPILFENRQ